MKKALFFLLLVSFSFLGGVAVVRWRSLSVLAEKPKTFVAPSPFSPIAYPLHNRFFTVVVVGHNNGAWVEKTLTSVFSQNYENFRIVYIDDGSDDGSFELARDIIYDMKYLIPTTLTRSEERIGTLAHLSQTIETCTDEEIVVLVDGNDWLAHEWVLDRLNQYYVNPDLWMACGSSRSYPTLQPMEEVSYPLQTFYASLFKRFGSISLELAQGHCHCLPDVLYIENSQAEKNEI